MKTSRPFLLLGIALFTVFRFLFPSNIPFINDEALLIQRALDENVKGGFTVAGLMGSRGLEYGPFAIWFYRLVLQFTQDLVVVALVKMFSIFAVTLGSVFWICRRLKVDWEFPVLFVLLSPYLWFYSRDLWDNCFVIPLSAAFFASYLDFAVTKRFSSLLLSALLVSLGFLTHLVFMPIVLAFAAHLILFEREYLRKEFSNVVMAAFVSIGLVFPYLLHAFKQRPAQQLELGNMGHLVMPFTGARVFTALGLEYFLGANWKAPFESGVQNTIWISLIGISALAYPFFIVGLFLLARKAVAHRGEPSSRLAEITLLAFGFQLLLSYAYRLIPIPNFHSAQWFVVCFALLTCLSSLSSSSWGGKLTVVYCFSLSLAIPAFHYFVESHGGSRVIHYGPTLGNQKQVAHELSALEVKSLAREAFAVAQFPFALDVLRRLESDAKPKKAVSTARIIYLNPENPRDGRITLKIEE